MARFQSIHFRVRAIAFIQKKLRRYKESRGEKFWRQVKILVPNGEFFAVIHV